MSTLIGEVENPTRTVPRALAGAVVLVIVAYLVPLLVALGVTVEGTGWELGYFTYVADKVRRSPPGVGWHPLQRNGCSIGGCYEGLVYFEYVQRKGGINNGTHQVGGTWLAYWIIAAAAASQIGQYQAEMSSDSYQVQGMAERGFLPKIFAVRSKYDTPTIGIVMSSAGRVGSGDGDG